MKIGLVLSGLLLSGAASWGQVVDCSTVGFEQGTALGWVVTNGRVTDANQQVVYLNEAVGTFEDGQYITSLSDGNDPKIYTAKIPMVAPGSSHSIRIGNTKRGGRFDRIKTTYVVTPDNTLFQYQFAAVLQNPSHNQYQQPAFSIEITNTAGTLIACNYYNVTAWGNISGFQTQGDIQYRNWTTGAIDLRSYVGQTITIQVTTHGCTEQRHFGYAYFDAQCLKAEVTTALYCPAYDSDMTLRAPAGFAAYTWSTGETTPEIKIKPTLGTRYSVQAQPFSSLSQTCSLQFDYVVNFDKASAPTEQAVAICEGDRHTVGDSTYRRAGTYLTHISRGAGRCDSLVRTVLTVRPLARSTQQLTVCEGSQLTVGDTVFTSSGRHVQRFSRRAPLCDSIVTTQVELLRVTASLPADTLLVPGDSLKLTATVAPNVAYRFSWSPAEGLSCPTCASTWAKPGTSTQYTLSVEQVATSCRKDLPILVKVSACVFRAPTAFTPNNDGVNDVFTIPANDCIEQIAELVVYDRWGEVMFRTLNCPPANPTYGWNGMYQGSMAGPGIYAYSVRINYITGFSHRYSGMITLIR